MKKIQAKLSQERLLAVFLFFLSLFSAEILLAGFFWARIRPFGRGENFNLLVLGMGGAQHEAADLTDTLIVVLANQANKKILLLSLPRDIWIDSLKTKINSLYHYGGSELVSKEVEKIIGQPIDKVLLVDFKAFEEIIDFIGGIEVNIEHAFDDYYYPIPGKESDDCRGDPKLACRYEHLHFDRGWQGMSAETALKFVRSRHAEGEEGTDFARNVRQQKVILALKNKVLSSEVLMNPKRIQALWEIAQDNIQTNIAQKDFLPLAKFFLSFGQKAQFESLVLDGGSLGGEGLLYHPRYHSSGQWVLLPVEGSWKGVRDFVEQKIN